MKTTIKRIAAIALTLALVICAFPASGVSAAKAGKKSKNQKNDTIVVKNQKQLDAALEQGYKTIKIKTGKDVTLKLPEAEFQGTKLVINAPNAKVINNATFTDGSITAKSVGKLTEKADGNVLVINADAGKIVIAENASNSEIHVVESKSDKTEKAEKSETQALNLNIKGSVEKISVEAESKIEMKVSGTVSGVEISAKSDVNIKSKSEDAPEIPITLTDKAEGSSLSTNVPVAIEGDAKIDVKLSEGAENSKVPEKKDEKPAQNTPASSGDYYSGDSGSSPIVRDPDITISYSDETAAEFRNFEIVDYITGEFYLYVTFRYTGARACGGSIIPYFKNHATGQVFESDFASLSWMYSRDYFPAGSTLTYSFHFPITDAFNRNNYDLNLEFNVSSKKMICYNDVVSVASASGLVYGTTDQGSPCCDYTFTISMPDYFDPDFLDFSLLFWKDNEVILEVPSFMIDPVDVSDPNNFVFTRRYIDVGDGILPDNATVLLLACIDYYTENSMIATGGSVSYTNYQKQASSDNIITVSSVQYLPNAIVLKLRNNGSETYMVRATSQFFDQDGDPLNSISSIGSGNATTCIIAPNEEKTACISTINSRTKQPYAYSSVNISERLMLLPIRNVPAESVVIASTSAITLNTSESAKNGLYPYTVTASVKNNSESDIAVIMTALISKNGSICYVADQKDTAETSLQEAGEELNHTVELWLEPIDPGNPADTTGYTCAFETKAALYYSDVESIFGAVLR